MTSILRSMKMEQLVLSHLLHWMAIRLSLPWRSRSMEILMDLTHTQPSMQRNSPIPRILVFKHLRVLWKAPSILQLMSLSLMNPLNSRVKPKQLKMLYSSLSWGVLFPQIRWPWAVWWPSTKWRLPASKRAKLSARWNSRSVRVLSVQLATIPKTQLISLTAKGRNSRWTTQAKPA